MKGSDELLVVLYNDGLGWAVHLTQSAHRAVLDPLGAGDIINHVKHFGGTFIDANAAPRTQVFINNDLWHKVHLFIDQVVSIKMFW